MLSKAALVETGPVTFSSTNLERSKGIQKEWTCTVPFFLASHPKYCYSAQTQYKKSWRYFAFIVGASSLKCVFYGQCTSQLRLATFYQWLPHWAAWVQSRARNLWCLLLVTGPDRGWISRIFRIRHFGICKMCFLGIWYSHYLESLKKSAKQNKLMFKPLLKMHRK